MGDAGPLLAQLVRDLMRLGVGMEVEGGAAAFTLPQDEPRRSRAEKAVRRSLPLVGDHRDEFLAAWREAAADDCGERCGECKARVFRVPEVVTWAFCEFPYCPYHTDARSKDAKEWRRRAEWKAKQSAKSDAVPVPD